MRKASRKSNQNIVEVGVSSIDVNSVSEKCKYEFLILKSTVFSEHSESLKDCSPGDLLILS